jgi:phage terminase large subunit-like protein
MTPRPDHYGPFDRGPSLRTLRLKNEAIDAKAGRALDDNAKALERVKDELMAAKGLHASRDRLRDVAQELREAAGGSARDGSVPAPQAADGAGAVGAVATTGADAEMNGGRRLTAGDGPDRHPDARQDDGAAEAGLAEAGPDAGADEDTASDRAFDGAFGALACGAPEGDGHQGGESMAAHFALPPLTAEGLLALPVPALLRLEARHALRRDQRPPGGDWRSWLILGGRGSGKTRAGAEWVQALATGDSPVRIALIGETLGDAREVMVDGVSGIWRIARVDRPAFEVSRRRLVWPNGSTAQLFSSEDPESLRGPQFDYAWADEIGKWKHAEETWDMLQFGLRLGALPRQAATTTPRTTPLLKRLISEPGAVCTRLSTRDNADNLAPGFIAALEQRYGGTRLGRQELDGEMIEDRDDALWSRSLIERSRIRAPGPMRRIVVAVDPPASENARDSCCGVVVAGLGEDGRAVVLADCSVERASPARWADAVVRAYRRFQADRVIAEINQGGDMVTAVLRAADAHLPVTTVSARRGKRARAEPVAALYEQGRAAHAGAFPALEDQMCDFGSDGLSNGASPDRLDALVWALTALMLTGAGEPRVRGV